jgi:hypothetical protein
MTLPRRELPVWQQFAFIAVAVPGLFWMKTGRVNAFAFGLTAFLLLLAAALHFLLPVDGTPVERRAANEAKPALRPRGPIVASEAQPALRPHPLDRLAVLWMLCIPGSPLVLYVIANLTTLTPGNWRTILGSKVVVCVVLPLIGALPLIRHIRGPAARYALLVAVVGTLFPVAFGLPALGDLIRGPSRERVTITAAHRIVVARRGHGEELTDIAEVALSDGRTLQANTRHAPLSALAEGPATLTYLRFTESILDVESE